MARHIELANHLVALLLTPALVAFCLLARPAWPVELGLWAAWLAAALLFDAWSPRVSAVKPSDRPDGATVLLLLWLPPLAMVGVLAWALALAERGAFDAGQFALAAFGLGLTTSTIGGGTAHELLHRRGRRARAAAEALTLFYGYPHYAIVHLRVHHAHTADPYDPGTSLLDEPLAAYIRRAMTLAWQGAWRVENRRLARLGLRPWHWRNRMTRALLLQAAFVAGIAALFGAAGLGLFVAQTVVAGLLILGIDYTQHYGVVRRTLPNGRLEPITAVHAWTSDHAFNRSVFYLGLHSDHHLQPQASLAERGAAAVGAPQAPFGYPGLFLLAVVPPLWFRVMNPRLADSQRQAG